MLSELKFCLVVDSMNNEKFEQSKQVGSRIKEIFSKSTVVTYSDMSQNTMLVTRLKPGFYIFFTDKLEEYEKYYERLKKPKYSILITENLHTDFISESVNISSEIIYGKADVDKIVDRIKKHILELRVA